MTDEAGGPVDEPSAHAGVTDDILTGHTLWVILVLAALAGAVAGFVGGAFRWLLEHMDRWRADIVDWAHAHSAWGWIIPIVISALAAAAAAAIARWQPLAAGSGIQHVEAVDRGESDPPPLSVVPARFVGGLLSVGLAGMVLGREGPTVHMAAAIGAAAGRFARLAQNEIRLLQTVLSGTGLAVAFNAPISAVFFIFEEVTKTFRTREAIVTMVAVAIGVGASRLVLGNERDFTDVVSVDTPSLTTLPIFAVFGVVVGVLGVYYNKLILLCLDGFDMIRRVPATVKAGVIGGVVGLLLFAEPVVVGGGDSVADLILAGQRFALPIVILYVAVRFVAGPVSYAAGTPGGIFAPILALGALMGLIAGRITEVVVPGLHTDLTIAFALVGMSTLFAAIVRAPFTGLVLVIEMTAITTVTIPMLMAGAMAVVVASLLRSQPIYDALRVRMLQRQQAADDPPTST
ncbi:ClC family H(+)/Cl(-) exchange transporter [Gordonia insulae]|uniref:H(+)/Cl(-) exchange transporter ClcA n=1 Tax=Gordonia insulae TaxID=2420509 RepID=A0A3G8JNF7_9ACTN|nr:ClC family H(+)/Cl(-) exchange transporter [Gordonia insulae]AZG46478.1 H(+)/Cl(-) exchange transporter ClcA [Gordonia insulae]